MNKQQKSYAIAKATYETAYQMKQEHEINWMKEHGRSEKFIFTVRNRDDFDRLNAEYNADETARKLFSDYNGAIDLLNQAENDLIEYGLSIIPAGLAEKIKGGLHMHRIRQRFIDLTFNLDVKHGDQEVKEIMDNLYEQTA